MDIDQVLSGGGLQSIARELGVSEADAARGAGALLPAILGGFKKQTQTDPAGVGGLGGLLGQLGGGGLLDDLLSPQPTNVSRGDAVLGQIFGSKDVSRTVAQHASTQSGLDASILKKMLPMLAMLVAGAMAKKAGGAESTGGGGGILGGILGSLTGGHSAAPGGGAAQGGGGLGSMLDLDGDGNALDDILEMGGKLLK